MPIFYNVLSVKYASKIELVKPVTEFNTTETQHLFHNIYFTVRLQVLPIFNQQFHHDWLETHNWL